MSSLAARLASAALVLATTVAADLSVTIGSANNVLKGPVDGRVVLIFAPPGEDPLGAIDVTDAAPNKLYGKNVARFGPSDTVTLAAGSGDANATATGVYGWPLVSLDELVPGTYNVQAFLNPYDAVTRADGSEVRLKFPCGDGAPNINGVGSLKTTPVEVEVHGGDQTITLAFDSVEPVPAFEGNEMGGCFQGNYADTENLKYVKILSKRLSAFWGRDMYVGANVLLPAGYNAADKATRYPVLYSQDHWAADEGFVGYPAGSFASAWNAGVIPGVNGTAERPTPKLIIVKFRHESPFYDDSYAVNTANMGPYGDAINEELIPHLDALFNTVAEPYARIQEGGSTGGWVSAASVIFRPDLFGACFSYYPDSLDFHSHQDIPLYTNANAYRGADGTAIGSVRRFDAQGNEVILATVEQENHWELVFGTSTRSFLQWDVWNAVFGVQGLNGYPLEPWDKVTGEIYPGAVDYWRKFDLSDYIATNWASPGKNLGETLKDRLHFSVGTWDNYYLNEGVAEFQKRTDALGGPGWANITILERRTHSGLFQRLDVWTYLGVVTQWIADHAPDGPTPLPTASTSSLTRGNLYDDIISAGGRAAALARQADPAVEVKQTSAKCGTAIITGTVGRWDPGVVLTAQWLVDGAANGAVFAVEQGQTATFAPSGGLPAGEFEVKLAVTGVKRGYEVETRTSEAGVVRERRRRML
ncbi:putative esterase [Microdochium nivale]|nr:putative esterase [Microdochium nivale]